MRQLESDVDHAVKLFQQQYEKGKGKSDAIGATIEEEYL
jgi:hypothetical protein